MLSACPFVMHKTMLVNLWKKKVGSFINHIHESLIKRNNLCCDNYKFKILLLTSATESCYNYISEMCNYYSQLLHL